MPWFYLLLRVVQTALARSRSASLRLAVSERQQHADRRAGDGGFAGGLRHPWCDGTEIVLAAEVLCDTDPGAHESAEEDALHDLAHAACLPRRSGSGNPCDHRSVETHGSHGPQELGVAEAEHAAIGGDQPVAVLARGRDEVQYRLIEAHRTGRPEEPGVARGEDTTVGRD